MRRSLMVERRMENPRILFILPLCGFENIVLQNMVLQHPENGVSCINSVISCIGTFFIMLGALCFFFFSFKLIFIP